MCAFGGRARATHREDNDLDLAMIVHDKPSGLPLTFYLADRIFKVLEATDIVVSPVLISILTWKEPESHSNPALLHAIKREGIVIPLEP